MSWFKKKTTRKVEGVPSIPIIQTMPTFLDLKPFPHVNIRNFFKRDFYLSLCHEFETTLQKGVLEADEPKDLQRFQKFHYGFDASHWQLPPNIGAPINLLYQPVWIEFFSKLFGVPLTKNVSITFHSQVFGSKPFSAHNDYCYVGMPKSKPGDDNVKQLFYDAPYFISGPQEAKDLNLDLQMRSVIGIFYLDNPDYVEGNGGETGLYESYEGYLQNNPVKLIPPISNSMLIFETTPDSFHTYVPNKAKYRNTLLFWLHSDADLKMKRFHGAVPSEYSYTRSEK